MSVFTEAELAFLREQRLGRLATANAAGRPHVVPTSFRHNPRTDTIDIGGHGLSQSKKWRDVTENGYAAFVVDDLVSVDPWRPRGIEVRGPAEAAAQGGEEFGLGFAPEIIRIRPTRITSWGLEGDGRQRSSRSVAPH